MIIHIVLFHPKPALSADERRSFAQSVVSFLASAPSVARASVGRSIDIDAGYVRSMGDTTYEYAAVIEFADEVELKAYLNHPRHAELGELFWQYCERSIVSEVRSVDLTRGDAADKLAE